jgi:hypothetical protein
MQAKFQVAQHDSIMVQLYHDMNGGENMPKIIPIRDLKNTSEISEMCHNSKEPIFVTKNGYDDMVIMSMNTFEKIVFMNDLYRKLQQGESSIDKGEVLDGFDALKDIRSKYGL